MNTPETLENPETAHHSDVETNDVGPRNRPQPLMRQLSVTAMVALVLAIGGFLIVRAGRSENNAAGSQATTPNVPITVSEAGRQVVQIQTVPVRMDALQGRVQMTGLVSYPADQTVKISPRLQGRIRQVFVSVGDHVSPGQVLAVLDSVDAATAQATALQSQNKLRLAKITLSRQRQLYRLGTPEVTVAQAALEQAKANALFKKDALEKIQEQARIGGFTQQPLATARTAVVQAQSTLDAATQDQDLARRTHDRSVKLNEIGVAAKQDLEAAENTLAKAQVTTQSDQDQLALAQETLARERRAYKTNLYADQSVRSAQNDYEQALLQQDAGIRALALAKAAILTSYQQAQSDFESAQVDAENSRNSLVILGQPTKDGLLRVTSPVAGVVVERDVNPGQSVDQSQMTPWQMFTISNTNTVWVEGDLYEKDLASITEGQPVLISVDALPSRSFTGVVRHIAPALDPKTRTIKVRAEIANNGGLLKDGMFAEMAITAGRGQAAPTVPLAAVQHDADSDYVYVAQGGRYVRRTVSLGAQKGGYCVVTTGLRPGERVVTQGAIFLGGQASSG